MYTHTFYRSYCIIIIITIIIASIIGVSGITNETHIFTVQGVYIFRKRVMCLQSQLIHIFFLIIVVIILKNHFTIQGPSLLKLILIFW